MTQTAVVAGSGMLQRLNGPKLSSEHSTSGKMNSRYYVTLPDRTLAPRPAKQQAATYHHLRTSIGGQAAREIRLNLRPVRTQSEVAAELGVTRSAVEQIELRALAKLYWAFAAERQAFQAGDL